MASDESYVPFSQRTGLATPPPQLKLGEVSSELRRLLDYYVGLEIGREERSGYERSYFDTSWDRVAMDFHVLFLGREIDSYTNSPYDFRQNLRVIFAKAGIGRLFDIVEFFTRHPKCSDELKGELAAAFVSARAAYRIIDRQIVAIGTAEQAEAFERAIADATDAANATAARKHLVNSGLALRKADWAGSVRESIHAVEAIAIRLAPGTSTLGPALAALEKKGHLHGGLRAAFASLYGYSSNEEGVRHSLVFKDEAQVDETDALFMLGACASFVSYLLVRGG